MFGPADKQVSFSTWIFFLLSSLTSLGLLAADPALAQAEISLERDLALKAEEIIYDRREQVTTAEGQVEAVYGPYSIKAPLLIFNHKEKEAFFPRGVEFYWENIKLTARSAYLDIAHRSANAQDVYIASQGFYFHGQEVVFSSAEISLKNAWVSTCDLPQPHWKIAGRLIAFYPLKEELTSGGSQLQLGDLTIMPLPSYTISTASLREGWFISPLLPHLGSRPGDGAYFEQEIFFFPEKRLVLSAKLGYALESGFILGGGMNIYQPDGGQTETGLYYRTSNQWEGGVRWQRQADSEWFAGRLGAKFWVREIIDPYRVSSRPDISWESDWTGFTPWGTGLAWQGQAGYLKEEEGGCSPRAGFNVRAKKTLLGSDETAAPGFKLALILASQNSWYNRSDQWLRLPGKVEIGHSGPVFEEELGYEHFFWRQGTNKFGFERVFWADHDELSGRIKIKHPGQALEFKAFYNLDSRSFRKIDLTFDLETHCLSWRLSWHVKEQSISLGLALGREEIRP